MRASLLKVFSSTSRSQPHPFRSDPNFCFWGLGEGHLWALGLLCKYHWAVGVGQHGNHPTPLPGDQDPDSPGISCSWDHSSFS